MKNIAEGKDVFHAIVFPTLEPYLACYDASWTFVLGDLSSNEVALS